MDQPSETCTGSAAVFWLSVALGVALVVVIILVIVYATKGSNRALGTVDIVAVDPSIEDARKPLVLEGPLSVTDYKRVHASQVTPSSKLAKQSVPKDAAIELRVSPHKGSVAPALMHPKPTTPKTTAAAAVDSDGPRHLTVQDAMDMMYNKTNQTHAVVVVADFCGACKQVKATIGSGAVKNAHRISYLPIEEFNKLDKSIRDVLSDGYIPQFVALGPSGNSTKGPTGNMKAEDIDLFITKFSK